MALTIGVRIGGFKFVAGFETPQKPRRVGPSIWQRVKQAAFNLAMAAMPTPVYV